MNLSSHTDQEITREFARRLLRTVSVAELQAEIERRATVRAEVSQPAAPLARTLVNGERGRFVEWVAKQMDITVSDLVGPRRTASIADRRAVAMATMRCALKPTLIEVAAAFNRTDHGTVLWAQKKVQDRPALRELHLDLVAKWKGGAR